jgi:NAD(P)-dependent dehydrogenase (short-subunit alcohol dehydrogenase family)
MSDGKLKNRVALITGASRGIGRAIANGFAREGAWIAVAARSDRDLASLADEVRAAGGRAIVIPADLCEAGVPQQVIGKVVREFGTIDILVNNAGVGSSGSPKPVCDYDDSFWNLTLKLNLTVPYLLCKYLLPILNEKGHGRIINIASLASKIGILHGAAYAASKHGLLGLTRTLALEVAREGITVNAICPGPVETEMNEKRMIYDAQRLSVSKEELIARATPLGRRLQPQEIVSLAVLLASDESAAITGQAINICGGLVMF